MIILPAKQTILEKYVQGALGLFARPHSPGVSPDEFSAPILKALV
jgi:hypothetical protein